MLASSRQPGDDQGMVAVSPTANHAAEACLADEARRVLAPRLVGVVKLLRSAALESRRDVEHVHRLRVAARRTLAALKVFAEVLPEKHYRWWRKRVRQIRRAAGEARDHDVLAALLKEQARSQAGQAWGPLLKEVAAERRKAQEPIVRLHKKLPQSKLRRHARRLLAGISDRKASTLSAAAQEQLRPLVSAVVGEDRERLEDDAALHRLRIRVKQLRYVLEILAGAWSDEAAVTLAGVQASVEKLQKLLGDHNDCVSLVKRLEPWRERTTDASSAKLLDALAHHEREAAVAGRRQFLAWWNTQERARLAAEFATLLGVGKLAAS